MPISLRKGRSSVYFHHEHTGHTIGAELFECEIQNAEAVLRFTLRPVDGNQRDDLAYTLTHPISYVQLNDTGVIDRLGGYSERHAHEFSNWRIEILCDTGPISLPVTPSTSPDGGLQFTVRP